MHIPAGVSNIKSIKMREMVSFVRAARNMALCSSRSGQNVCQVSHFVISGQACCVLRCAAVWSVDIYQHFGGTSCLRFRRKSLRWAKFVPRQLCSVCACVHRRRAARARTPCSFSIHFNVHSHVHSHVRLDPQRLSFSPGFPNKLFLLGPVLLFVLHSSLIICLVT